MKGCYLGERRKEVEFFFPLAPVFLNRINTRNKIQLELRHVNNKCPKTFAINRDLYLPIYSAGSRHHLVYYLHCILLLITSNSERCGYNSEVLLNFLPLFREDGEKAQVSRCVNNRNNPYCGHFIHDCNNGHIPLDLIVLHQIISNFNISIIVQLIKEILPSHLPSGYPLIMQRILHNYVLTSILEKE